MPKVSKQQLAAAQAARELNLLEMPTQWLLATLLTLGLGTMGTQSELIERLHKQIWLHCYDQMEE
jgi:hypothetical protein